MPTFVEKMLGAPAGAIVFSTPDLVLTHDNTASIYKTFQKMGGVQVFDPERLVVVLDHNAPPTTAALSNTYQSIREFVEDQGISRFHDAGSGICHQIMAGYARPGMIIVATKPFKSSSALWIKSWYHSMISSVCSTGHRVGPPITVFTGWA